jgi:TPR repeat protein
MRKAWCVPEDNAESVKWFRKGAERGDVAAQINLGNMYYKGEGVPEDYARAYAWWNLAAAQGHKPAAEKKEILRKQMTPAQIAEAQKLSRELCAKIPNCVR